MGKTGAESEATAMKNDERATGAKTMLWSVAARLFFVFFYGYVWLIIEPRLIHHSLGIQSFYDRFAFHTDWSFFQEHLARVGGPVEYAARLLSQCYRWDWAGALIVTAVAWCASLGADFVTGRDGRSRGRVLRYVPAAMLLVMVGGYLHPLNAVLALLAAFAGYVGYVRWAPQAPARRLLVLLLAAVALYWFAGSGSLLFPILVALEERVISGRKSLAAAAVLCVLVIPAAAAVGFDMPITTAYAGFLVSDPGVPPGRWSYTLALYLFFPTLLAGTVFWDPARARPAVSSRGRRAPKGNVSAAGKTPSASRARALPAGMIAVIAFFLAVGGATWISRDALTRSMLEIDYYSQHQRWDDVLRAVDRLPDGIYTVRCHRNTMLALYHTGQLGDAMFRYPQRPGVALFYTPKQYQDLGIHYQESRLFLDLGQVNHAERCAYEALAASGDHPAILQQLALIHIVKDRAETASIFLQALARHLFHRQSARDMLERLRADPRLADDPRVLQIRKNMSDTDIVLDEDTVEDFLQALLEKNPQNKLAFELLMAHFLSTARPEKVVENLPRLKDLGYRRIPRHYQEAIVLCAAAAGKPTAETGWDLDPLVLRRAREFQRICSSTADPLEAGGIAMAAGLDDSYFFFSTYGMSGR